MSTLNTSLETIGGSISSPKSPQSAGSGGSTLGDCTLAPAVSLPKTLYPGLDSSPRKSKAGDW